MIQVSDPTGSGLVIQVSGPTGSVMLIQICPSTCSELVVYTLILTANWRNCSFVFVGRLKYRSLYVRLIDFVIHVKKAIS